MSCSRVSCFVCSCQHLVYPEAILLEDPNVYACLMFGRGRFQNGVLIQPEEAFDPSDEAALEAYRNKIWCGLSLRSCSVLCDARSS